nr:metallophosphoesterase [Kofleriaceae bacterium]
MIAYVTDVEGQWDKLASFAAGNPHVHLADDGTLELADGVTFVFGGDAIDRGPAGQKIVDVLLRAKQHYGARVVLLAGNRDINKMRLRRELAGAPPAGAPTGSRADTLKWIFANTMGAPKAFAHRASELSAAGRASGDDTVAQSFLDDLAPGGALRSYLQACQLGYREGATLFVHGGVTGANLGVVPGQPRVAGVDAWVAALNEFYAHELAEFRDGRSPDALIQYQAPHPGTHENPDSVVYARPTDDDGNPRLPPAEVVARLRADGVTRVVLGHTPSGDCPALLRDGEFEVVLADNSYSRREHGSKVAMTDDRLWLAGETVLDGGEVRAVSCEVARGDASTPIGLRDRATGQLVKIALAGDGFLMFRGLPKHEVEQLAASRADVAKRTLEPAR